MLTVTTVLIWLIALLPLVVAIPGLAAAQWDSPYLVLTALGRLTGVAGLSFLLVAAALSSRVPGFDRCCGGLTKLWKTHHYLGAVAFLLLLAHPLLLALSRAGDLAGSAAVLFPATDAWAIWLGWGGLLLMMIFLAPSFAFFGQPDYSCWKRVHALAAPAIALALAHSFALDRAIAHPWDYLVWGMLALLAILALLYRWLFSRAYLPGLGGRLPYQVTRVEPVSQSVVEISLQPMIRDLTYDAGQFVYFTPLDPTLGAGYREEHPYTLSSSPREPGLRVTIKDLGDASRALQHIRPTSEVRIEGPYGAFFAPLHAANKELWIAGGIGITPFLSRARLMRETACSARVCLIFCVQDEARTLFLNELNAIADALPGFDFHMHYFYREGPLDRPFIEQRCDQVALREIYICGPAPLQALASGLVHKAGAPSKRIHTEEFDLL